MHRRRLSSTRRLSAFTTARLGPLRRLSALTTPWRILGRSMDFMEPARRVVLVHSLRRGGWARGRETLETRTGPGLPVGCDSDASPAAQLDASSECIHYGASGPLRRLCGRGSLRRGGAWGPLMTPMDSAQSVALVRSSRSGGPGRGAGIILVIGPHRGLHVDSEA